jgi:hypothetical protein
MSLSTNPSRGTADPVDVEYLHHEPEADGLGIHIHLDAVDGVARDVIEGFKAIPRRGVEVGGLLLGKVIGLEHPDVWIERYQRLECKHRFGPQFVLDDEDRAALEAAAQRVAASTELSVVGLYRSHTRSGFQLEESDLELVDRYFSDSSDLVLLIRPENTVDIEAQFFARNESGAMRPLGKPFPFRGRVLRTADFLLAGDEVDEEDADPAEATRQTQSAPSAAGVAGAPHENGSEPVSAGGAPADVHATGGPEQDRGQALSAGSPAPPASAEIPAPPRERIRRLVPDFAPAAEPVEPGGVFSFEPRLAPAPSPQFAIEPERSPFREKLARWWPLAGAILLVCGAMWFLFGQNRRIASENAADVSEYRPVGMYVDPGPQRWRISWNPSATAFHNARSVALFVHDGEAEDRVDLTKQDVAAGAYSWQPNGNDVTFRLETIDTGGRISAESFRVIRPAPATAPSNAVPAPAPKTGSVATAATQPEAVPAAPASPHFVPAKAVRKVPPVVPASIRPRIHGSIPIDVRVHIDARGRVTSAIPVVKQKGGLNSYLASRAVYAARLWRFTPARENGRSAPSTQTIHFVFEK